MLHCFRALITAFVLSFATYSTANIGNSFLGSNITSGGSSDLINGANIFENPAMGAYSEERSKRDFSMAINISGYFELRGIQNADQSISQLQTELDSAETDPDALNSTVEIVNTFLADDLFRAKEVFNGNFLFSFSLGSYGNLSFHYGRTLFASQRILSQNGVQFSQTALSNLIQDSVQNNTEIDRDDIVDTLAIDAGLYLKYAFVDEFSLDYSYPIGNFSSLGGADIFIGTRLKLLAVTLEKEVRAVRRLIADESAAEQETRDAFNSFQDSASSQNAFSPDAVALDFGIVFDWEWSSLGFSAFNINTPSLDYPAIGLNCSGTDVDCFLAESFSDQIALQETYVIDSRYRIEGGVHSFSRRWNLLFSYDLKEFNDPVAETYQWSNIVFQFVPSPIIGDYGLNWIPSLRFSYNKNLTGLENEYYAVGTTWGFVTFDLAFTDFATVSSAISGEPTTEDFGDELHTLAVNVGLDLSF